MKKCAPEPLESTARYVSFSAQYAIRDLYDALVELITNADDSYGKCAKGQGTILIEAEHRHEGGKVIVRDRAGGLSAEDMRNKLKKIGERSSFDGARGFMARGAKDCAALGKLTFESIKDGYYNKCEILPTFEYVPYLPQRKASEGDREHLGIPRGNGTVVTLELKDGVKLPRHDSLKDQLPRHFALRDIFTQDSNVKGLIKNLNRRGSKPDTLTYLLPAGEKVVDEKYDVPGYSTPAQLIIYRAPEAFEDEIDKRFRKSGILIKGKSAIHEATLFSKDLEQDPYATRYFGKLICPHIDTLCDEYDQLRGAGSRYPATNPSLVIDPNRQGGLRRDHPFTQALFEFPKQKLKELIEIDRNKDREQHTRVANEKTEKQLKLLAQLASRFLQGHLEEFEEISTTTDIDSDTFTKKGVLIIPTFCTIAINEERIFTFRAKRPEGIKLSEPATVSCDDASISLLTKEFQLNPSRSDDKILTGNFKVKGNKAGITARITVKYDGLPEAEALVSVVETRVENVELQFPMEFDRDVYKVKEGKKKTLVLRAKTPEVLSAETYPEIISDCPDVPIVGTRCKLIPAGESTYAEGKVYIEARRLHSQAIISAQIGKFTAIAKVKVVQDEESGPPLRFELRDEHFGNLRARWDRPENPNVLLIAGRHESIARYLGSKEAKFPGQDSVLFKILLAEIVAENVCRKALEIQAGQVPWEFENLDIEGFYAKHNKLMREFTPTAHKILISDSDVTSYLEVTGSLQKEVLSESSLEA